MDEVAGPSTRTVEISFPGAPAVACWLTTSAGGTSDGPYATLNLGLHVSDDPRCVIENRRRVATDIGFELDDLIFMNQTHSSTVAIVTAADRGRGARRDDDAIGSTDAMITADGGVPLVVMVADCTPIVVAEPTAGLVAVVHAGWRGVVAGICSATVASMVACGGDPTQMVALVGPSVDADRYEVGPEVTEGLYSLLGERAERCIDPRRPRSHVDLAGANVAALEAAGIPSHGITRMETTTAAPWLFSDRRARPCGRFAMVATRTPITAAGNGS